MKNTIFFISVLCLAAACSGVKKTQKALNVGDYGNAIHTSVNTLAKNKGKKSSQPYILMLEEAYKKNTERELKHIKFLESDENPAHFEEIYQSYVNLHQIQEKIKPLLPLYVEGQNRKARFIFKDYEDDILDSKDDLAEFLYENASSLLLEANSKEDYRKAYDDFIYLEEINPGYDDTANKILEAYEKGLDFVSVDLVNNSNVIIPARLEEELLNFDVYGLDQLWTKYHSNPQPNIDYDYHMQLSLRNINISPEHVSEKQLIKERQIKDGYQYATDRKGNILKDSLGNKIKVDNFKTVKCNFYQFTQLKSAKVDGFVKFTDLRTQQQLNSYPISSEFIFEHVYARHDGDKRAIDNELTPLLKLGAVPFPSNEQMVYDAGEDIKNRLKSILKRQRFN